MLTAVFGTGALAGLLGYVVATVLPKWITGSFVDVIRYLDTSPRSYEARRNIRSGAIDLLRKVNKRYDRVIVVGHSLGSYIAYDAIRYLWADEHDAYAGPKPIGDPVVPAGLDTLEKTVLELRAPGAGATQRTAFRAAQRTLWEGLRDQGHTWRITDLVSLGSPLYMADQIYARDSHEFATWVDRHEFPQCPPVEDHSSWTSEHEPAPRPLRYSYVSRKANRRVLYDAAAFGVVRWTNLWFPTTALFFGDWFGGPLAPLFGAGVLDRPVGSGSGARFIPGYAHSLYYKQIAAHPDQELALAFHDTLKR